MTRQKKKLPHSKKTMRNLGPVILTGLGIAAGIAAIMFATKPCCKPNAKCSVVMYSMKGCPYCDMARKKLQKHVGCFTEHEYVRGKEHTLKKMPNGKTPEKFPQIWVNGKLKGGYSEIDTWISQCSSS